MKSRHTEHAEFVKNVLQNEVSLETFLTWLQDFYCKVYTTKFFGGIRYGADHNQQVMSWIEGFKKTDDYVKKTCTIKLMLDIAINGKTLRSFFSDNALALIQKSFIDPEENRLQEAARRDQEQITRLRLEREAGEREVKRQHELEERNKQLAEAKARRIEQAALDEVKRQRELEERNKRIAEAEARLIEQAARDRLRAEAQGLFRQLLKLKTESGHVEVLAIYADSSDLPDELKAEAKILIDQYHKSNELLKDYDTHKNEATIGVASNISKLRDDHAWLTEFNPRLVSCLQRAKGFFTDRDKTRREAGEAARRMVEEQAKLAKELAVKLSPMVKDASHIFESCRNMFKHPCQLLGISEEEHADVTLSFNQLDAIYLQLYELYNNPRNITVKAEDLAKVKDDASQFEEVTEKVKAFKKKHDVYSNTLYAKSLELNTVWDLLDRARGQLNHYANEIEYHREYRQRVRDLSNQNWAYKEIENVDERFARVQEVNDFMESAQRELEEIKDMMKHGELAFKAAEKTFRLLGSTLELKGLDDQATDETAIQSKSVIDEFGKTVQSLRRSTYTREFVTVSQSLCEKIYQYLKVDIRASFPALCDHFLTANAIADEIIRLYECGKDYKLGDAGKALFALNHSREHIITILNGYAKENSCLLSGETRSLIQGKLPLPQDEDEDEHHDKPDSPPQPPLAPAFMFMYVYVVKPKQKEPLKVNCLDIFFKMLCLNVDRKLQSNAIYVDDKSLKEKVRKLMIKVGGSIDAIVEAIKRSEAKPAKVQTVQKANYAYMH